MASNPIYIVVSEEYYGGESAWIRAFLKMVDAIDFAVQKNGILGKDGVDYGVYEVKVNSGELPKLVHTSSTSSGPSP